MATQTDICNRALQKLGAKRITSVNEDSVNARHCLLAYDACRLGLLEDHDWNCAVARAELAASSTEPDFGRANQFPVPSNFIRLMRPDPLENINSLDWQVEGRMIVTDDSSPIQIRYIYDLEDVQVMSPLFREALSAVMAIELCEAITQSNTKKDGLRADLAEVLSRARKANAIQNVPADPPEDTWVSARL